ncbi:hypothetical protein ACFQZ4_12465 [Catellatospora coxensis]
MTDYRGSTFGWSLVGTLTDFTGTPGGTIPKANLSWTPPAPAPPARPTPSPRPRARRVRSTAPRCARPRPTRRAPVAASTPPRRSP